MHFVRFWHLADIPVALSDVRFHGKRDLAGLSGGAGKWLDKLKNRLQLLPRSDYESGGQEFESLRARQFPAIPVRFTRHSHRVRSP